MESNVLTAQKGIGQDSRTILDHALEYHSKGIKVVKAFYKGKYPANGDEWKRYRTEPITVDLLSEWFGPEATYGNISAITGTASGGLTVLDFDVEEAYQWWVEKYPFFARILPTSKTGRGYHIFFRSELDKDDTSSLMKMDVKAKGLVAMPPSMHKTGVRYKWIIPLPDSLDDLPMINPYDWSLDNFTDGSDGSDGIEGSDGSEGVCESRLKGYEQLKTVTRGMIDEAIESTLPKKYGERNGLLFLFARKVKWIDEIKNWSLDEVMFIADMWHEKALPNIETKSLLMTQARFKNAWEDARFPPGEGESLNIAKEAAFKSTEPMAELELYEGDEIAKKVIRLCFELQRLAGPDGEWFIPTNKAEELFGVSHSWLAMILKHLDGTIIKKTKKHTRNRCTRYIFIGPSIKLLQKSPLIDA